MSRKRRPESSEDEEESISSSEDSVSSDSEAGSDSEKSNGDEDEALVNCDFEFFDPQKQDFLGIKHLLRQLLDTDADFFDLGALTEMILAQPLVGSTVKTEGHEGDPLSFLTVLNLRVHKDNPVIKSLLKYFSEVSKSNTSFQNQLSSLLDDENGELALVLSERIVNIPSAVAAPSYKMLLEEIQWANEEKEPYRFSHFLILSRTYIEQESEAIEDEDEVTSLTKPRPKRQKRKVYHQSSDDLLQTSLVHDEIRYFHPEDELFSRTSDTVSYSFTNKASLEEQNVKTSGLLILLPKLEFETAIGEMQLFLGSESQ